MGECRGDVDPDVVPARQVAADFAQRLPFEDQFARSPAGFLFHVAVADVQFLCGGVVAGDFTGVQPARLPVAGVEGHRTFNERYGDGPLFERGVHVEFGAVNSYAQSFHLDREGAFGIFGDVEKSLSAEFYVAAFGAEGAVVGERRAALEPYGRTVGQMRQRLAAEGAELLSGRNRCAGEVGTDREERDDDARGDGCRRAQYRHPAAFRRGPFRPLRRSADFDAGLQLLPEPVAVGIVGRGAALYVVPYAEGVFVDAAVVRIRDPPVEFAARCGVQRALQRTDQEVPVMFVHDGIRFLPEDTKKAADPYGRPPFFRFF